MNKLTVPESCINERADAVLSEHIENISRSNLKNRINSLTVNGHLSRLSKKVSAGDVIEWDLDPEPEVNITAEDVKLDIIYEDDNVFVINKPSGMVVHPAAGNYSGTMAQGLMYRLQESDCDTDFSEGDIRPGIVHRLDKDTSGIIIAAKNTAALESLSAQFRNREASKTYLAVINGKLPDRRGQIETLIGRDPKNRKKMTWKTKNGKHSLTIYRSLFTKGGKSFVALDLKTGRTHQLRVHMLSMNAPIVGDPVYSRAASESELMLHAYRLKIRLPGEDGIREFRAPLPERFKVILKNLSGKD